MALVLQDRVRVNSADYGTGDITLGAPYPGYRSFASCIPDGSLVYYCIHNTSVGYDTEWEVGYGTYVLGTNTLQRNTGDAATSGIYSSSNANAYVDFTAGANGLEVFITQPSEQAVYQQENGDTVLNEGVLTVLGPNVSSYTTLDNSIAQYFANQNNYAQINMQNQSSGNLASSDYIATANDGTADTKYVDLGINGSGFADPDALFTIVGADGAYLYASDGEFAIGTANTQPIKFFVDGTLLASEVGRFSSDGNFILYSGASPTDTGHKLQVTGSSYLDGTVFTTGLVYSDGNVASAANGTALTTRDYVDGVASAGLTIHTAVLVESDTDLGANYNQPGGAGVGVGATLTNNGANVALTIGGVPLATTNRVLVNGQANAVQNGIYTVTVAGAPDSPGPGAAWVLTRATDADTYGVGDPNQLGKGSYFYVQSGTPGTGESYVCNVDGTITFGVTDITFSLFSAAPSYIVNPPLSLVGNELSLGTVPTTLGGTNLTSYTTGDMLYASGSNILANRTIGNTGNVLNVAGGVPTWGTLDLSSANAVSSTLPETHGGTGQSTYTTGDLIYASATNTLSKLAGQTTVTKKYLSQTGDGVNSAAPAWAQVAAADISGLAPSATTDTSNATNITSGTLPSGRISGSYTGLTGTGTLTVGTWNANTITTSYGGTGVAGTLTGLVYANGATAMSNATAAEVVAVIGSTAVANATYAVSSNSSTYTSNIIGGAAGSLPYQTSANATVLLATGSGVLVGGTTPAWSTSPSLNGANFTSIPNGATTATAANTASAIVARDASGNFTAGTITANLTGTASSATTAVNVAAANLTGTTLSSNVTASSLTSFGASIALGTPASGTLTNTTGFPAANLSGTTLAAGVTGSSLTSVGTIGTGTWNASFTAGLSGANLASLNASNISSGTIGTARLGSGTADSTTYLRGDSTWATVTSGITITDDTTTATALYPTFTSATSGSISAAKVTSSKLTFVPSTGTLTATVVTSNSDERLKEDWKDVSSTFLVDLAKVKHGTFKRIDGGNREPGVTAQSLQAVLPEAVAEGADGYLSVNYGGAALVAAIELAKVVEELRAEVKELKAKLANGA